MLVVLSVWKYSMALAVISASVVILTAAYILWTIQRVYLGPEYKGPHGEGIYSDDDAGVRHRRAAAGVCDRPGGLPAGAVQLHGPQREPDRR